VWGTFRRDPTVKGALMLTLGLMPLQDHDERNPNDGYTDEHDDEIAR
jgi:hypothetical protein